MSRNRSPNSTVRKALLLSTVSLEWLAKKSEQENRSLSNMLDTLLLRMAQEEKQQEVQS